MVFWCLIVSLVWSSANHRRIGVVVFLVTCLIEISQVWHPAFLVAPRATHIGGAILGDDFDWGDFPHYALGAVVGTYALKLLNRRQGEMDGISQAG